MTVCAYCTHQTLSSRREAISSLPPRSFGRSDRDCEVTGRRLLVPNLP